MTTFIMTHCRRLGIITLFALLPFVSAAQESSTQTKTDIIDRIIAETSVEDELNSPIEQVQNQFSQNPFGLPADKNEEMMNIYADTFKPDATVKTIRTTFANQYNQAHAKAVLDWLNDEETQKVLDAEKEFFTLQGIRKRVVTKYELEQNPPNQDRKDLIQSLAQTTSASETELEARTKLFRTMVSAFSKLSDQRSFNSIQIDNIVNNFRSQIEPQINQQVADQLLVKYHGLDDATLKNYTSFYSTDAGQWLNKTTSESIRAALEASSENFISTIE